MVSDQRGRALENRVGPLFQKHGMECVCEMVDSALALELFTGPMDLDLRSHSGA